MISLDLPWRSLANSLVVALEMCEMLHMLAYACAIHVLVLDNTSDDCEALKADESLVCEIDREPMDT